MGCCNRRCGLIAGAVCGALLAVLGGVLIPAGNSIIEGTVKKEAVIKEGTTAYDNWVSAGAGVYRQFWFFDVTNPEEIVKNGSTPVVVQRGPYTYKTRYLPKTDITFSNFTASFELPLGAIFEPSMSVGPEEDNVTVLNLVVATRAIDASSSCAGLCRVSSVCNNSLYWRFPAFFWLVTLGYMLCVSCEFNHGGAYSLAPSDLHGLVELWIQSTGSSLFQRRSVKELLWGYYDPMLKNTTGLFHPYNGTSDGPYTVFTGQDDIAKVGKILSWKKMESLTFWDDKYCNMLNGTDASSFAPFVNKEKPLYFFSSDICRSVSASYVESLDLKGIEVYRYALEPNTLAAPNVNPDNHCFCRDPKVTKNCTLAGVLDISSCQDSKPIYISLPHFLYGSPSLRESVLGLSANLEHHDTFLDVEPITGFTLRFAKRIQVNMMYGPSKTITVLKKVKDYTIFPLVWLNETAALDDETAEMIKAELFSRVDMLEKLQLSLLGIGVSMFVLCFTMYCVVRCRSSSGKFA